MADLTAVLASNYAQQRFWASVDRKGPDECWHWNALIGQKGYGSFSFRRVKFKAHRVALALSKGVPTAGLCALHSCDNPPCVNPAHLRWGTNAENHREKADRGRSNKWNGRRIGEGNPKAKLTAADVLAIRAYDGPQKDMTARYGLTNGVVSRIVNGLTWTHIVAGTQNERENGQENSGKSRGKAS
jgi:hypothetical protein